MAAPAVNLPKRKKNILQLAVVAAAMSQEGRPLTKRHPHKIMTRKWTLYDQDRRQLTKMEEKIHWYNTLCVYDTNKFTVFVLMYRSHRPCLLKVLII